jgi:hypothetical protein
MERERINETIDGAQIVRPRAELTRTRIEDRKHLERPMVGSTPATMMLAHQKAPVAKCPDNPLFLFNRDSGPDRALSGQSGFLEYRQGNRCCFRMPIP